GAADAVLYFVEDLVEHVGEGGGAGAHVGFGLRDGAGEDVVVLASADEVVGDVERREDSYAQGVDRAALGGDGAHLGIDQAGEVLDVGGGRTAQVIDLIVDFCRDCLIWFLGWGRGFKLFELLHVPSFPSNDWG